VAEGHEPARHAAASRDLGGLAVHDETRRPVGGGQDLEVTPCHSPAPPRAERLHRRFLRREARGVARETSAAARLAILLLRGREDALAEAAAARTFERAPDALDVAQIDAEADDQYDLGMGDLSTRRRCGR
jgi:hypothetical protein